jgi:hypothetical protein
MAAAREDRNGWSQDMSPARGASAAGEDTSPAAAFLYFFLFHRRGPKTAARPRGGMERRGTGGRAGRRVDANGIDLPAGPHAFFRFLYGRAAGRAVPSGSRRRVREAEAGHLWVASCLRE